MEKYYKAKDLVSYKCHKEMKDTWIASFVVFDGTIKRGSCTSSLTMHQQSWKYAHSSSLDVNQFKVVMEAK
jgi:hypothetical protein